MRLALLATLALFVLVAPHASAQRILGGKLMGGALPAASGGGGGPTPNCTFGSDCLCDTIYDDYPSAGIFGCEDFEDPALPGITTPGTWDTKYPGEDSFQCEVDAGGGNARTGWVEDSAAVSAGKACLHHAHESDCEVSGETDCVEDGSGGTYSIGFRYQLNENFGIDGIWTFPGGPKPTLGFTYLQKFSANFDLDGGPAAKPNQFGNSRSAIMGAGNWHSICVPEIPNNLPFGGGWFTGTGLGGDPSPGAPTVREGAACVFDHVGTMIGVPRNPAVYQWGVTWGPGQWGCWQGKMEPAGGGYSRMRIWFTPVGGSAVLVFDADIDTSNLLSQGGAAFDELAWNHYFNGPGDPGDGWQDANVGARWEDNWVLTNSDPVPCSAVSSSFPAP